MSKHRIGSAGRWDRDEELGVYGLAGWFVIIVLCVFGVTQCNRPPDRLPLSVHTPQPTHTWAQPTEALNLNLGQSDKTKQEAIVVSTPTATSLDCLIKGNISIDDGEKIYHVPGQKYYEQTKISTQYGERWFCSEAEAEAAGWRRARE